MQIRSQKGIEREHGAWTVPLRHFIEHPVCVLIHAGFAVQGDNARGEAFFGYVLEVLLVFEDVLDRLEALSEGEATNGAFVNAVFGSEAVDFGSFLEVVDEAVEVAFVGEVMQKRLDGR